MEQYNNLVRSALLNGHYKPNRTGIDTISNFSESYKIDISEDFPLMTTKDLSGGRWESLVHEFLWYLSGEEHIRNLQEHTSIWDAWATEDGMLDTTYGRFWRKFPAPQAEHRFDGENWADDDTPWVNENGTIDQVQYAIEMLNENPQTRRMVITAWHPANSTTSTLPPCHFTYVLNVQGDGTLNCHLTQRSGDIAVGIPFNIASYALLTKLIAQQTGYEVGEFSHTIVDAHIYCGSGDRGEWYNENLSEVQEMLEVDGPEVTRRYIEDNAPPEETDNEDHLPNLLEQLTRDERDRPQLNISEDATIDNIDRDDIELENYNPHPSLRFYVAE